MAQLYRVDEHMNDPVEIIDASFAEVRACIFLDTDEQGADVWSFELQKRETGRTAGMRYYDAWKVVTLPKTDPTFSVGIRDMAEVMTRAVMAVASLVVQQQK